MTPTLIQGTRRPFAVQLPWDGVTDMTTVTAVDLYVHRGSGVIETWACTLSPGATQALLVVTYTPQAAGVGSVLIAGEPLRLRPILHFASGPDIECSSVLLTVEAR